jgi:hypothetical protein
MSVSISTRLARIVAALVLLWGGGCAGPSGDPGIGRAPEPAGVARDAFVVLSGGGTPFTNHYSQYVQARALAQWLEETQPAGATWCFFGAGNRTGEAPVLADVFREVTRDGVTLPLWLPGVLPRNRPATKESVLRTLRDEVLPRVRDGGTLYLFIGDHGEVAGRDEKRESAITLWQYRRRARSGGWLEDRREVLGVTELRNVLAAGLGRGRVVFGMTQCHSGGFHELAVPRTPVLPRAWFGGAGGVPAAGPSGLRLRAAGFTATDEDSPAAGCEPNPEPDSWVGYERFLPEALLGRDLMNGLPKGGGLGTLAEAHEAAVLVDRTIDKPRATSEHYLAAWADVIETQLARTLAVTERVRRAVGAYQQAVDRGRMESRDPEVLAQQAQYARFVARLGNELPDARELLATGVRPALEFAIRPPPDTARGGRGAARRAAAGEVRRAWSGTLRPAWRAAVLAGRVGGLTGPAAEFERHLLQLEEAGGALLAGSRAQENVLRALYGKAGYHEPGRVEAVAAVEMARWAVERRGRIIEWGATAADPAVRAAAAKLGAEPAAPEPAGPGLTRRTAAERVLFYRRVLAAWEFLLALDHREALAELRTLREIERAPVPGAGR